MEENIGKAIKTLKIQYYIFWLLPLLLVIGFETGFLGVGMYADDPKMQYILETIGILVAIACVPAALKLFSYILKKKIDAVSLPVAMKQYQFWSGVRLGILELAAVANLLIYYFTLNNIGGFCALIAVTASLFCFPGEKRMREELYLLNDENNLPGE